MTTYEYEIGTGGDYATLALWQTARAGAGAVSGDIERALLLDGTYAATTGITVSASWATGVILEIQGKNSHLNDWSVTTQGVLISFSSATNWITLNGTVHLTIRNVVVNANSTSGYVMAVQHNSWSSTDRTLRLEKCMFRSFTSGQSRVVNHAASSASRTLTIYADACVFRDCSTSSDGAAIQINSWGSGVHARAVMYVRGCTFKAAGLRFSRLSTDSSLTLDVSGSLIEPPSGYSFLDVAGTSGALTATSVDNIGTATEANHETNFTSAATNYTQAAFVTGTPASGEVGFTNITDGDYSLVDHPNNVALDYVTSGGMPSFDVLGVTRGTTPDCGAFEVIAAGTTLTPGIATATLTAFAPTVVTTADVTVVPGAATATLTAFAPTVVVTADVVVAPGVATATLTPHAPTVVATADVVVVPGAGTVTLTAYAPTVVTDVVVRPGAASATLTAYAPTVVADVSVTPGAALATLTPYSPSVIVGASVVVEPGAGSLTAIPYAPTVAYTQHVFVSPGATALTLTPFAPTLVGGSITALASGSFDAPLPIPAGAAFHVDVGSPGTATAPKIRLTLFFRARQHGYLR